MKKVYKIFKLMDTSLESETLTLNYNRLYFQSYLLRSLDSDNWQKSPSFRYGFETLEEAEKFIEENIEDYDNWTIIAEYGNK